MKQHLSVSLILLIFAFLGLFFIIISPADIIIKIIAASVGVTVFITLVIFYLVFRKKR